MDQWTDGLTDGPMDQPQVKSTDSHEDINQEIRDDLCLTFRWQRTNRGNSWMAEKCFIWKKFVCEFENNIDGKMGNATEDEEGTDFVSAPVCVVSVDPPDQSQQSGLWSWTFEGGLSSIESSTETPAAPNKQTDCFRFIRSQRNRNDSRQFCQDSFNASLANFSALLKNESLIIDKLEVKFSV